MNFSAFITLHFPTGYSQPPQMYMDPNQYRPQAEADPGTMGQMDVGYGAYAGGGGGGGYEGDSFDEEQPLLKELGIDLELIRQKVSI